MEQFIQQLR